MRHLGLPDMRTGGVAAQRVTAVQSSLTGTNFPQTLAQNVTYTPWGAVSQIENGCVGSGRAQTLETYSYNNRLQAAQIQLSGSPSGGYTLAYNYYLPGTTPTGCPTAAAGTGNNGKVIGYTYTDTVNNSAMSHSALYVYDTLNRPVCAQATSPNNNPVATYDLVFSYDRYGNMACVQNGSTNGPCPQWTYNTSTNQLSSSTGFTYDAAGNLTTDVSNPTHHTYQWDAEGRVSAVDPGSSPTWSFTYNAVGDRAQWAYGSSGGADQHLFDPEGNWLGNYGSYTLVPLGGRYLVVYTSSETNFDHINALGSTTMWTSHSGVELEDILFYPWGDLWKGSGGYNFASLPYRDLTTTTDLTTFRVSSPNLGRWLSPDPVPGDPTNPQTWNRYAYALNNPTTLIDPLGLDPQDAGNGCTWDPDTNTLNCPPPPGPPTMGCANMDGYGCGYNGPNTANWGSPTYPGGGSGNGANNSAPQSGTSACTVTNGMTTAVTLAQMDKLGAGAFGFLPPVGSVAIDPWALGLQPGEWTNSLLGPNASQITFSFSPSPNLPQGFPTTHTLGSILGGPSIRFLGSNFNGLFRFDIFGLPSNAAANAATGPAEVTVTYPSSLPVNCGGPLLDSSPTPPSPSVPVAAFRRHF